MEVPAKDERQKLNVLFDKMDLDGASLPTTPQRNGNAVSQTNEDAAGHANDATKRSSDGPAEGEPQVKKLRLMEALLGVAELLEEQRQEPDLEQLIEIITERVIQCLQQRQVSFNPPRRLAPAFNPPRRLAPAFNPPPRLAPAQVVRNYKTVLCRYVTKFGSCPYGDRCNFAQNIYDLRGPARHFQVAANKSVPGRHVTKYGSCPHSDRWNVARGRQELREPARQSTYRTQKCPWFNGKDNCPFGTHCKYIHNGDEPRPAKFTQRQAGFPRQPAFKFSQIRTGSSRQLLLPVPQTQTGYSQRPAFKFPQTKAGHWRQPLLPFSETLAESSLQPAFKFTHTQDESLSQTTSVFPQTILGISRLPAFKFWQTQAGSSAQPAKSPIDEESG